MDEKLLSGVSGDDGVSISDVEHRTLCVGAALHQMRLDQFLAQCIQGFSRSYLKQLIDEGAVQRDGVVLTKPSQRVKAGDVLGIQLRPPLHMQAFTPEDIALDVVYEDADLLVLNKPAGMVVHPAPGNWTGTVLNALLHHYPDSASVPRAGIVHRLDKDTSGLMLVARHRTSADALIQLISTRTVQREYWALAHGHWQGSAAQAQLAHMGGVDMACNVADAGSIAAMPHVRVDAAIGRDAHHRLRMAVVDINSQLGKPAQTDFTLIANSANHPPVCWVQARLHTGRTHQIRVHMRHLGHPLLADALYGGAPALGMERQALHAFRLRLPHPCCAGQVLAFHVPPPADMQRAIGLLSE